MANLVVLDGGAATKYLKTSGAGDNGDPHIPEHLETNSASILTAAQAIQTAVEALDNAVSGSELQVDVVTLPNVTIGAAIPAGTNNIGDVDIATIAAGETHIGEVAGSMATVAVTLTRPADTTAYTAKDAISDSTSAPTVLTFANLARVNAGSGYIVKARLMTNQSTNVARYRLHIFDTAPAAINDNAAYTLLWANRATRIGYIDFAAAQTEGSGSDAANSQNDTVRLPFVAASGSRAVYGLLEALDAFTPASAQVFYIGLTADLN